MKVKMKVQISGTRDGVEWPPIDQTLTVNEAEGKELIAAGLATNMPETASAPETATARKAETGTRKGVTARDLGK